MLPDAVGSRSSSAHEQVTEVQISQGGSVTCSVATEFRDRARSFENREKRNRDPALSFTGFEYSDTDFGVWFSRYEEESKSNDNV